MTTPEIPTFEEVLKAQVEVDKLTAEAAALAAEERVIKDRLRVIEARRFALRDWRDMGEARVRERYTDHQSYQLPSRTYEVHPDDRHHLRIYAEKSK